MNKQANTQTDRGDYNTLRGLARSVISRLRFSQTARLSLEI